jgi:hypothetical protein
MGQSELDHRARRLKFERHPRWPFAAVLLADQHVKGIGKQAQAPGSARLPKEKW